MSDKKNSTEANTNHASPQRRVNRERIFGLLRPYRKRFTFALLAMAGYGATDGVVPLLIRRILDDIFGAQNRSMLYVLPLTLVVFAVIRGTLGFAQQYLMAGIGLGIVRDLRNQIHERLLSLSQPFFDRHSSGSLISRVTNDSLLVRQALTDSASAFLRDTVRVIALLITALYLDPILGFIALFGFPLGVVPVLKFGKKVRRLSRVGQDQFGGLTSALQESIGGHAVVQSFALEQEASRRFRAENESFTNTFLRAEKYGALSGPTNELLASLAMSGVILYGGFSVLNGVRTQGDFIAFITTMFLLYEPLKKLGRANTTFQTGMSAAERIFEILDTQPEVVDRPGATTLNGPNLDIEYRDVSFRYEGRTEVERGDEDSRRWSVESARLSVKTGETIALVGMSGGGKSTLVKLLPRFYDPQVGAVFIGGTDIRDYTLASLRAQISIVNQQPFLFHDTIFQNILYGRLGASREEVLEAAKAAHVHEFVQRLPSGYDTLVGEQGMSLSGGERARVAIARALLKNSPILILDEATASLDSESEALVQDAIDRLMVGRTVFVIAHRLATIRGANKIAVLVHGRIVEYGTHQELLSLGGEYSKLYHLQFSAEAEAGERKVLRI